MESLNITKAEFGAKPNLNTAQARKANFLAIHKAQRKIMNNSTISWRIYFPPGIYYFDKSIHIFQKLEIFGSGKTLDGNASFESIIKFTNNNSSLVIHGNYYYNKLSSVNKDNNDVFGEAFIRTSTMKKSEWKEIFPSDDTITLPPSSINVNSHENYMPSSFFGAFSQIRDIQVWGSFETNQIEEYNGLHWSDIPLSINLPLTSPRRKLMTSKSEKCPGIDLRASALLYRVQISNFEGTGLQILSNATTYFDSSFEKIKGRGYNVYKNKIIDSWYSELCIITNCGGHGLHTSGYDSQAGICKGLRTINIIGNGIFESSFLGNAYYSCYIQNSKGHGIRCDSSNNYSAIFYSCMEEGSSPNWIRQPAIVIGGNFGSGFLEKSTNGSINVDDLIAGESQGTIYNQGLRIIGREINATLVKNINNNLWLYLCHDQSTHENSVLGWKSSEESVNWWLKHNADRKVWTIGTNYDFYSYFTGRDHARGMGYPGSVWQLLGSPENPIVLGKNASNQTPKLDASFDNEGDIRYNPTPSIGSFVGWVCVKVNGILEWRPFGKIE